MPNRNASSEYYRYGFGKHENDDEVFGEGNYLDFGNYGYNTRIGRRLSIDPLFMKYPSQSPYSTFNNNPVLYDDSSGKSGEVTIDKENKTLTVTSIYAFYGSKSSPKLAKQYAENIKKAYNDANGKVKIDGIEYKVKFEVIGIDMTETLGKNQDSAIKEFIHKNKDIAVNFIRLENYTDSNEGVSYTDGLGGNTGYWSISQIKETNGTTVSHEHNHGLNGLEHPEDINSQGGNLDQEVSIDMTYYSYNYAKTKYRKKDENGNIILDTTKRKVYQKNIEAIFTPEIKKQLKEKGKAQIGKLKNEFHGKVN